MVDVLRFLNDSGLELSPDKSRMEYCGFLIHPLSQKSLKNLNIIQNKALRIAMGYRQSTSTNIMFAEAKEPPIHLRMQYLCYNFLTKLLAKTKHPLIPILDHIIARRENPTLLFRGSKPLFLFAYEDTIPIQHYIACSDKPWCYNFSYESLWFIPDVDLDTGISIQKATNPRLKFENLFRHELRKASCWFTDGSKIDNNEFAGFANLDA
ncbi:Protein of unknown function [Cotesia congregata]|uniref:Reverse transcriptase domain-containing protein n=1 Tax=Cotesia congregata TaxID=51543 RepID=A0A8J2MTY6_COTCN|nr:Protein of unknown function [Cotesia congregata]